MEDTDSLSKLALEANESHKNALEAYTNKLQTELLAVDKLIAAVEQLPENESLEDPGDKWCLHAENAFKPTAIIDLTQTRHENSPFYEDSLRRDRYVKATVPNPFSNSEKRYLEKAVVKENKRLAAVHAKKSGQDAFEAVTQSNDFFLNNVVGIDWTSVARDVSASNYPLGSRTAQECKVRWLGAQHPNINNGKWTDAEEERLRELVDSKHGSRLDWEEISQLLGTNRTPLDCIRKFQTGGRPQFRWTKVLDKRLMDAVRAHGNNNWTLVATAVSPEVSANQCQIRYGRSVNPDIKRGKFTTEEDQLLQQAIEAHGLDWVKVAQAVPGRTNVQCRDRYIHQLTGGTVKAAWTDEEDARLKNAVKKLGNHWEQVREEMGCARSRKQYASRHKVLAQRDAMEGASQTAARDPSIPISQGEPSGASMRAAVDPGQATILQDAGQDDTGSTTKIVEATQKPKLSKVKGVKRGRKKKSDLQPGTADLTSPGDSLSTSIPKKRPKPRPRYKGATAAITSGNPDVYNATSIPTPERRSNRIKARDILKSGAASEEAKMVMTPTGEVSRKPQKDIFENAAATLAAELSDLTDLEDLDDALPPKKRARTNVEDIELAIPTRRSLKPRSSLGRTTSTQKPKPPSTPRTTGTRSSRSTTAHRQ